MLDSDLKNFLSKEKTDEEELKFFQEFLDIEEQNPIPASKLSNILSPCYKCKKHVCNYQKKEINNKYFCRECCNEETKIDNIIELKEEDIIVNEKQEIKNEEFESYNLLEELINANKINKENKIKLSQETIKKLEGDLKTLEKYLEKYPLWIQKDFSLSWKKFEEILYNPDNTNAKKNLDFMQKFFENKKINENVNHEFLKKYEEEIDFLNICNYTLLKKNNFRYFIGAITKEKDFQKFNLKNNLQEKILGNYKIKKIKPIILNKEVKKLQNLQEKTFENKCFMFTIKKISKWEYKFFQLLANKKKNNNLNIKYTDYLKKSKNKAKLIIEKISKNIKKTEKKQTSTAILKNSTNFLKFMSNLRKFQKIFSQYSLIENEIKFYLDHTKNFTPKKQSEKSKQEKTKPEIIDSDCAICFSSEVSYYNNVIYCHNCKQGAHLKCLDKTEAPPGNYFCFKCSDRARGEIMNCLFCGKKEHFLSQSKISNYKKSCIYHGFCLFSTKSWKIVYKGIQPNVKGEDCCGICYKKKGVVGKCFKCGSFKFHHFCAYFEGFYFLLKEREKMKFKDFVSSCYSYEVIVFCGKCSQQEFLDKKDIVRKNSYYRRLSIMPDFFREFPSFEDFSKRKEFCN